MKKLKVEDRLAQRDQRFKDKVKVLKQKGKWTAKMTERAEKKGLKE